MRAREGGYRIHTIHANTSRADHAQMHSSLHMSNARTAYLYPGETRLSLVAPSLDGLFVARLASSFAATGQPSSGNATLLDL
jgi:hypothetical protein